MQTYAPTTPPAASPIASPSTTASANRTPSPSLTSADPRIAGWQADLAMLVPRMDALHPALDHGIPLPELEEMANVLSGRVPDLTDDELMTQVIGIVAAVSRQGCDGHTGAYVWGSSSYPLDSLPLRLWLFGDDVYVVDALPPYTDLVGRRLDSIIGHPTAEIIETVEPIVPRDNDQTVRLLMPRFLLIPQILRGFGLLEPTGSISLGFDLDAASARHVGVDPIPMADYNDWAGGYGLHLPADRDVLYLSRIGDDIWWERLDDGTLFVQYNRVDFSALSQLGDLMEAATDPATTRVVVDLRHNFGGERSALEPVVAALEDPLIDRPGKLFVITGRNSFSAASMIVARLVDESSAVIVGEPMGGCPTFWADTEEFVLPYSSIGVSVSTMFEIGVSSTDERLTIEPNLPVVLKYEDWAAGVDPALRAIQALDQ
ncbi:MAG: hypothetical protein ABIP53_04560 [Candidatus Limnocylindrales bacterium]